VLIPWLREKYDLDVITLTANLGTEADLPAVRDKALRTGASQAFVEDARDVFVRFFCWPDSELVMSWPDVWRGRSKNWRWIRN
jgi:argininosuccinate synthase